MNTGWTAQTKLSTVKTRKLRLSVQYSKWKLSEYTMPETLKWEQIPNFLYLSSKAKADKEFKLLKSLDSKPLRIKVKDGKQLYLDLFNPTHNEK